MTVGITTLSIMTFAITTLSIAGSIMTVWITILSTGYVVRFLYLAKCRYAECQCAERRLAEWRGAIYQSKVDIELSILFYIHTTYCKAFLEYYKNYSNIYTETVFKHAWVRWNQGIPKSNGLYYKSYGECTTSRRASCPKRFHEKIFYLSCIFL